MQNEEEIIRLYESGKSSPDISKIFLVSSVTVRNILRKHNVQLRQPQQYSKKYRLDLSIFKTPTELGSYWLGYLSSRARIYRHKTGTYIVRCQTPLQDIDHLFQLAKDLGTEKMPIIKYGRAIFQLNSKELHDIFNTNQEYDIRHFARGMIDASGQIIDGKVVLKAGSVLDYINNQPDPLRHLYCNCTRYLGRNLKLALPYIFEISSDFKKGS